MGSCVVDLGWLLGSLRKRVGGLLVRARADRAKAHTYLFDKNDHYSANLRRFILDIATAIPRRHF